MTRIRTCIVLALGTLALLAACDKDNPDTPPNITYGVSVCADCDMIISDERYASATIAADERGHPTPLLFDDIGDQIKYEAANAELHVLSRWVHDHATRQWIRAESASYVRSSALHTPMASGIAAFASRPAAEAARAELPVGEILMFVELWPVDAAQSTTSPTQNRAP